MAGLFNEEITEKIRVGMCAFLEDNDDLFQWIAVNVFGKAFGEAITASEEDQLGFLQQTLGRGVCDLPLNWVPSKPTPPFTGGQIEGANYDITIFVVLDRAVGSPDLRPAMFFSNLTGKISAIALIPSTTSQSGWAVQVTYNSGASTSVQGVSRAVSGGAVLGASFDGIFIVRDDGLPDDGGDPRPVITKTNPPQFTTDIEYEANDGSQQSLANSIFILGDVNLSPNGNLSISFDNSDLQLNGDINLFPRYSVSYKNPISPSINKPKTFDPQGSGTTNPEDDLAESETVEEIEEGDDPIIAVVVKSQRENYTARPYTEVPNGSAPTLIVPRVAWVSFKVRTGEQIAWMQKIDVTTVDAYIVCPHPDGAIAYSVQWDRSWKGTAVGVQGKPLSDVKCCDKVSDVP